MYEQNNSMGSNTSKGFKTFSFGTFFYAQGLRKVLVEIPI